jgi:hypothetical protein
MAGCGLFGTRGDTVERGIEGPKYRVPFGNAEPENFQCEIVETAGSTVRRKRLAKKGNWRRVDFDLGEPTQRALLETDKEYILDIGRGLYAETEPGMGGPFSDLTHELLNTGQHSEFEETASDGEIVTYAVRPSDSVSSEFVVHYDRSIGLPVKQEYFSLAGGARTLSMTVEMINFVNEAAADLFIIPDGYRKVPVAELTGEPGR